MTWVQRYSLVLYIKEIIEKNSRYKITFDDKIIFIKFHSKNINEILYNIDNINYDLLENNPFELKGNFCNMDVLIIYFSGKFFNLKLNFKDSNLFTTGFFL